MPFFPDSLSCPQKLSSEYKLYTCGNFSRHSSILEKIAILVQPPRPRDFTKTPHPYVRLYFCPSKYLSVSYQGRLPLNGE